MKKIDFVNGTTINGAETFNEMQDNVEKVFNGNESMGSIVVDDIRSKNMFNSKNVCIGYYINGANEISYDANCCYGLDLIEVEPNTQYTISSKTLTLLIVNEYTIDKVNQGGLYHFENQTGLSHENTHYVRISTVTADKENVQLEQGTEATPLKEHIDFKNKPVDVNNMFSINSTNAELSTTYTSKIFKSGNVVWLQLFITLKSPVTTALANTSIGSLTDSIKPLVAVVDKCMISTSDQNG